MATRRPKVPRADALGQSSSGARPASGVSDAAGADGADVIKAEFGAARSAATPAAGAKAPVAGAKATAAGTTRSPGSGSTKTTGPSTAAKGSPAKGPGKATAKSSAKAGAPAKDARDADPVPAKAFSGRMLALAVVMIAITIMLAPTVKIFLEKRAEISALEAEIAGRQAEQTELNKQLSRWQDPNYVKQQARDRINMVMPGETGYWVFGGEDSAGTPGGRTGSGSSANPENLPWVDALWESIRRSATD